MMINKHVGMANGNSDAGTTYAISVDYHDDRMHSMQRDSVTKSAVLYD
jgi:hypothetical protein